MQRLEVMVFKEDVDMAKQRLDAWWDHEMLDRPAIGYYCPRQDIPTRGIWDGWALAKNPDGIDAALDDFEYKIDAIEFGGECLPSYFMNYGPGILACLFGATMTFRKETSTVWFERPGTTLDNIVEVLESAEANHNNPWFDRLVRVSERASERAQDTYIPTITDLGGILDVLASLLKPVEIFKAMRKNPGLIDTCRAIILDKWHKVFDETQAVIDANCHGTATWHQPWCRKKWYILQCDFSYMLSPDYFRRFVLPDLVEQASRMDYAIYHLDGVNQLPYLDDLLAEPTITGIQWVPGDGKAPPGSEAWMDVYRKIQASGKNITTEVPPENLARMYRELDPKGLYVFSIFIGRMAGDFFLPEFMGGQGGVDEDDDA
jgi:5-methyltetrahydrofolate--homocysteine methyltransferase